MVCRNSHIILQTNLSFVVVPTFKESICRVQISTFKIMSSLRRIHIKYVFFTIGICMSSYNFRNCL
ncbi:hypothetical protein Lepto1548_16415 [Leptospira interrogans serovar Bataviae]|nr:hypothetical protein Lepto1548_16415 [Leptospira interrogans serovar Bataviae]